MKIRPTINPRRCNLASYVQPSSYQHSNFPPLLIVPRARVSTPPVLSRYITEGCFSLDAFPPGSHSRSRPARGISLGASSFRLLSPFTSINFIANKYFGTWTISFYFQLVLPSSNFEISCCCIIRFHHLDASQRSGILLLQFHPPSKYEIILFRWHFAS